MMMKTTHTYVMRRVVALVGLCAVLTVPATTWAQDDDLAAPADTTLDLGLDDGPKTRAWRQHTMHTIVWECAPA